MNSLKYLLIICGFVYGYNMHAQGTDCSSAVPANVGLNIADGPSSGFGAQQVCQLEGTATHADWYTYTPAATSTVTIASCYAGEDTRVSLYDGSCATLSCLTYSDDDCEISGGGSNWASTITFIASAGTTYRIQWDDRWSTGSFNWLLLEDPIDCPTLMLNIGDPCDDFGIGNGVVNAACVCESLGLPSCATLVSPADGAAQVLIDPIDDTVEISWTLNGSEQADFINLYWGNHHGSMTLKGVTGPNATSAFITQAIPGEYYWSAVPANAAGELTTCDVFTFTAVEVVQTAPPNCPTLLSPTNGETNVQFNGDLINFSWDNDLSGDIINNNGIYLGLDPASLSFHSNLPGAWESVSLPNFEQGLTYYWSIVPSNDIGSAVGCDVYSFTIAGTVDCPLLGLNGLNFGNPCDDGDASTVNDVVDDNTCICAGTPIPANATCAGAVAIGEGVYTANMIAGGGGASDVCFSDEAAESALWFKYTPSCVSTGIATVSSSIDLDNPDTRLSVYTGTCAALTCLAFDDNSGSGITSAVTFPVENGTSYFIEWDDRWSTEEFNFEVSILCAGVDSDGDAIEDLDDNCPFVPNADQSDFDFDGIGDFCDVDIDGDGDANLFDCAPFDPLVFQGASCDDSDPITFNDIIQADCSCAGAPLPSNATCAGATLIGEGIHTANMINGGGGASGGCFGTDDVSNSLWFVYTPSCPTSGIAVVTSSIDLDEPDTRLSIYKGTCAAPICFISDDDSGAGFTSQAIFPVNNGQFYLIEWDDRWGTEEFDFEISISCDTDEDSIVDDYDNCPAIPNTDQADFDFDGIGDVCDVDIDGDGTANLFDCAPFDALVFEGATCDDGDPTTETDVILADCSCAGTLIDADGDGVTDSVDNCPLVPNTDQADFDLDGMGDACDVDIDGDGIANLFDCAPFDELVFQGASCDDEDPLTANDVIQEDCSCLGLPIPVNVECSDAIVIEDGIYINNYFYGGSGASESCFGSDLAIDALWFVYIANGDGNVTVDATIDPDQPNTRVSIYLDGCEELICIASNDDADATNVSSLVTFPVTAENKYLIEWDDRWGTDVFDFEVSFTTSCPTDLNNDGVTDGDDFSIFLGNFGIPCTNPPCNTDFNNDLNTDGDDFSIFLGNFGLNCTPPE